METYQHMVFRTALNIVQQEQEAEDIAQEVFIQVHDSIGSFRGDSKLSTWLYRITISKSLNRERKKKAARWFSLRNTKPLDEKTENEAKDFFHPGVLSENREDAALLLKAIRRLPGNQQSVFILLKIEELSYEEAAGVLNLSVKAIESLMQRAKAKLRKELENHFREKDQNDKGL